MAKRVRGKAPKLAQVVAALPVREWASLDDAFERAKLYGSAELAGHDLKQDFLTRQLQGAVRYIAPDGTETCFIFEPAWWRPLKISCPPIRIIGSTGRSCVDGVAEGWDLKQGKWHWLVRRVELDKVYPGAEFNKSYPVAAPSEQAENPTTRRKPGRPPKHDWDMVVARELIRMALAGEKMPPTAPKMLQFCENKWRWQPDIRQMQRLLSKLLD
jgi:hypothetical protein